MTIAEDIQNLIDPTPEVSAKLHGESSNIPDTPSRIMKSLIYKDKTIQEESFNTYESFKNGGNLEDNRTRLYKTMTNTFYNLATDFYEYGWGNSFHFSRRCKNELFETSIVRHENNLFRSAGIKEGDKVLDVGCGVGGPARECVRFTGAHVVGINNNDYQLEKARRYAKISGQESNSEFVKGDFLNMPFPDNTFDAVYAIEATCHAPELYSVYKEMFRVLKPGGKFAIYEWCITKGFSSDNKLHDSIIKRIEYGNGIPKLYSTDRCIADVEKCGFKLESSRDISEISVQGNLPWYTDLFQDYFNFSSLRSMAKTKLGITTLTYMLGFLTFIKVLPKSAYEVNNLLYDAAKACVDGSANNIFTPMFQVVAHKPKN
ncbi:Sterol 24-C-methyltransferase [Smittium culicis]|uniref:Sterol 24-C-methyltransferase n=1 Tax=Smittium culicis TaxID=133412 RepID=A0A1R1X3T4_9FUNG|nr:Sterol 24-C-methyltransferase [Smittium culicis]